MKCSNCGTTCESHWKYCPNCQHELVDKNTVGVITNSSSSLLRPVERVQVEVVQDNSNQARCPKCGSISLQADKKGFGFGKAAVGGFLLGPLGLLAGGIGSKKMKVVCLGCGHKWTL